MIDIQESEETRRRFEGTEPTDATEQHWNTCRVDLEDDEDGGWIAVVRFWDGGHAGLHGEFNLPLGDKTVTVGDEDTDADYGPRCEQIVRDTLEWVRRVTAA